MAWKKTGKPQAVKCNHALHAKFATMEPAPNDRPMRIANRKFLRSAILEGRFRNCNYASAFCKQTGKLYRVNGKHTSSILNEMNGEAPKDLWAIVEEYECDTLEDVAKLYSTFDVAKSARTPSDINRAYAASHPDLEALPERCINVSATGMSYYLRACKSTAKSMSTSNDSQERRAQRLLEYPNFVCFLSRIIGTSKEVRNKLARGPVAAAMFGTWLKSQSDASDFWLLTRDDSHPKPNDATRVLSRFLLKCSVGRRNRTADTASELEVYTRCIHAWNAWRKGESTTLKYFADKPVPAIS
jgi:hypothetical protein